MKARHCAVRAEHEQRLDSALFGRQPEQQQQEQQQSGAPGPQMTLAVFGSRHAPNH
jgi:hypothetical protein